MAQPSNLAFAVQEFTENVRLFRVAVDLKDKEAYEKAVKDKQARDLKQAERAASRSK